MGIGDENGDYERVIGKGNYLMTQLKEENEDLRKKLLHYKRVTSQQ